MTKRELAIYYIVHIISTLLLGIAIGLLLANWLTLTSELLYFYFFFPAVIIMLINLRVYGKKYQEFIKSLK